MVPMTIELSSKVKEAIPKTIEQILELTKKLHAEFF
jgi:Ni,Fe-hydrogenase maturation factor